MELAGEFSLLGAKHFLMGRCIIVASPVLSLYKGIGPLWGRQIPYTMMKFGK